MKTFMQSDNSQTLVKSVNVKKKKWKQSQYFEEYFLLKQYSASTVSSILTSSMQFLLLNKIENSSEGFKDMEEFKRNTIAKFHNISKEENQRHFNQRKTCIEWQRDYFEDYLSFIIPFCLAMYSFSLWKMSIHICINTVNKLQMLWLRHKNTNLISEKVNKFIHQYYIQTSNAEV